MAPEALLAIEHNMFTPGNYFYNGIGHVTVCYDRILNQGLEGIIRQAQEALEKCKVSDEDYSRRSHFLSAVILSCQAAIDYAHRYARLALEEAERCTDQKRKLELALIAKNCAQVPGKPARDFYEACQSFWFIQMLLQVESSGHSISPGRFDQYMYPFLKNDLDAGNITYQAAQEIVDCVWVKLNDLNKARDAASAEGFAGYSLFQNLIAGRPDSRRTGCYQRHVLSVPPGYPSCHAAAAFFVSAGLERQPSGFPNEGRRGYPYRCRSARLLQ